MIGKRVVVGLVEMDSFRIVYLIDNAQQFWSGAFWKGSLRRRVLIPLSELEDILKIPGNASLSLLDATLKRSIAFCASYHGMSQKKMLSLTILSLVHAEQYLQSPLQLEHACNLIFDSELFAFHSGRMCEILTDEAAVVSCDCKIPLAQTN